MKMATKIIATSLIMLAAGTQLFAKPVKKSNKTKGPECTCEAPQPNCKCLAPKKSKQSKPPRPRCKCNAPKMEEITGKLTLNGAQATDLITLTTETGTVYAVKAFGRRIPGQEKISEPSPSRKPLLDAIAAGEAKTTLKGWIDSENSIIMLPPPPVDTTNAK